MARNETLTQSRRAEASVCAYGSCDWPAEAPEVSAALAAPSGFCKFHALQAAMDSRRRRWPEGNNGHTEYRDAEVYVRWVRSVLDTHTLTYRGLTLATVDKTTLAALTGVDMGTIGNLRRGLFKRVKFRTAHRLDPYVTLTSTTPPGVPAIGEWVDRTDIHRLPKGSVIVDRYRRAWQSRDGATRAAPPVWYPAHGRQSWESKDTDPNYPVLDKGPRLPATVVWLAPSTLKGLHR